jgi:hypothetical protein
MHWLKGIRRRLAGPRDPGTIKGINELGDKVC